MNEVKYRIKYKVAFNYPNSEDDYIETFYKYFDDVEIALSFYWKLGEYKYDFQEDKGKVIYISLNTEIKMKEYIAN